MKRTFETYCQVEFLEWFYSAIPNITLSELIQSEKEFRDAESYMNLFNIISKRSILLLDDLDSFKEIAKSNPYFNKLLKNSSTGGSEIIEDLSSWFHSLEPDIVKAELLKLNPMSFLYFGDKFGKEKINGISLSSFINFKESAIENTKYISVNQCYTVSPNSNNTFPGWQFLNTINLPLNSALICDPYLFAEHSLFKYNLFIILENLLPIVNLECDFHLSFLINNMVHLDDVKKMTKDVEQHLIGLNRPYKICLSVYMISKEKLHDRNIITNYYRINSGRSFNYYSKNGDVKDFTNLQLIGRNGGPDDSTLEILEEFRKITCNSKSDFDLIGKHENRLII